MIIVEYIYNIWEKNAHKEMEENFMKKQLFTAAMVATMGLAVVGCGATGVSGDVTSTAIEEEMDMTVTQQMTEEVPEVEMTTAVAEESTEAATVVGETASEMTTAEATVSDEAATATEAEATTEAATETEAE